MKTRGNIYALIGISGSGKSTKANKLSNNGEKIIVSRDAIRRLIFGLNDYNIKEYFECDNIEKNRKEDIVTKYVHSIIDDTLSNGTDVILDETNLNYKRLQALSYWNTNVTFIYCTVKLDVALQRDSERLQSVGEKVIKKQMMRCNSLVDRLQKEPIVYYIKYPKMFLPRCVIFDIDGTMSHINGRAFYDMETVDTDLPDKKILRLLNMYLYFGEFDVIICSGRNQSARTKTIKWLENNNVPIDKIKDFYFRRNDDKRTDWMVKEEMWKNIEEYNTIDMMVDDRMQVVRRARALGYKVLNVENNTF